MQLDIIDELVQDAVRGGAKVLCGGKRNAALAPGLFYEPTVRASLCAFDPRPVLQPSSIGCAPGPQPPCVPRGRSQLGWVIVLTSLFFVGLSRPRVADRCW